MTRPTQPKASTRLPNNHSILPDRRPISPGYPKLDSVSDFFLTTDVGLRAKLTKTMFSELKVQLDHNNQPAPGKQKDDTKYLLNLGWTLE